MKLELFGINPVKFFFYWRGKKPDEAGLSCVPPTRRNLVRQEKMLVSTEQGP